MRNAIKTHNYDSVAGVEAPGQRGRIHDADLSLLSPTGLTFVCIPKDFDLCAPSAVAIAYEIGVLQNTGPLVALCPRFFNSVKWKNMVEDWRASGWEQSGKVALTSGFTLLHEVQHLSGIVGKERRCTDIKNYAPAPTDVSKMCYHPYCCKHISDKDKIRNAQNLAYFALDVTANRS
ncbi:hypothetical protein LY76DRAFT_673060 [Colletotrichum caudatum]|nr:hypothetical protein LY76DRAFT_673060 [Colletotrichum caudatum]